MSFTIANGLRGSVWPRFFGTCAPLLLILGSGCSGDRTPSASDEPALTDESSRAPAFPDVVANYRGGVVRRAEFDRYVDLKPVNQLEIGGPSEDDWRVSNVEEIVVRKVLEAEGLGDDPVASFEAAKLQAAPNILLAAMAEELGWNRLSATPEELREYYDRHRERYRTPKMARAEHIFLRAEDAVLAPAQRRIIRDKLEGIRQEILGGADFTQMIVLHSEAEDQDRGGVMNLKADARVFPAFAEAVWSLEVGDVSEVIDIPTGFQLVKMKEIVPEIDRKFEDVIEFVERVKLEEKLQEAQKEFVREAGERHGLEQHYERLDDPFIPEEEILIALGESSYRFRDLQFELPSPMRAQLYTGYLVQVQAFLDEVTRNRLMLLEADRLELIQRESVAAQIDAAVAELAFQRGFSLRLQEKDVEVSDADLREFFRQHEKRFQTVRQVDLDIIMIKHEPDEPFWSTLRQAEDLAKLIREGADFAELAREHSVHYSAQNGGRMDRLTDTAVGELVSARAVFRKQLKSLGEGEVSEPLVAEAYDSEQLRYIRTGATIVRVVKEYPPEQQPFEAVEELVRSEYVRRNYQQFEAEIRSEVLGTAAVEIRFENLPPI